MGDGMCPLRRRRRRSAGRGEFRRKGAMLRFHLGPMLERCGARWRVGPNPDRRRNRLHRPCWLSLARRTREFNCEGRVGGSVEMSSREMRFENRQQTLVGGTVVAAPKSFPKRHLWGTGFRVSACSEACESRSKILQAALWQPRDAEWGNHETRESACVWNTWVS